jgi:hypothetical protein
VYTIVVSLLLVSRDFARWTQATRPHYLGYSLTNDIRSGFSCDAHAMKIAEFILVQKMHNILIGINWHLLDNIAYKITMRNYPCPG